MNALNQLIPHGWRLALPWAAAGRPAATAATPPLACAAPATPPCGRLAPELVTVHQPGGAAAEGFRTLRSQLALRAAGSWHAGPALAVIGADRGDGRSWCAANLAVSMAQRGGPVLLIDANLRQPHLHTLFGLPEAAGLAEVLGGQIDACPVQAVAQLPGLFVLAAGQARGSALELLEQPALTRLLQTLGRQYAHVVVDTPAATLSADAAVVAARCDAALLVLRRHASTVAAVQALRDAIAPGGTPLAGVVLNGR